MSCDRICATCAWWTRSGPKLANATRDPSAGPELGVCQINPPVVVQGAGRFPVPMYPETHESRFCSRWASAEAGDDPDDGERNVFLIQRKAA